ncbi:hypothetical protein [Luteimonas notoginsengisoli]|uniref:Anti-sigma factor n=1 Tax=Luteimonas notoginsengisoli TaxID=1578200 RepID=A0ABV7UQA2_9GAMM
MTPDDILQAHLQQLQDAPLPPDLWRRVDRARRYGQKRRIGIAASTLALAAVVVLLPLMQPMPVARKAAPTLAATPSPHLHVDADTELRALDRTLQAGYARNASDAELEPLWAQRRRLLAGGDADPDTPRRRGLRI